MSTSANIGIIALHNVHEYNTILQCLSLQEYLKSKGYTVSIINYRLENIDKEYSLEEIPDFPSLNNERLNQFVTKRRIKKFWDEYEAVHPGKREKYTKLEEFINNRLNVTEPFYTLTDILNAQLKYDVLIAVGAVWDYRLTKGFKYPYFLKFGDNDTVRIAYAASLGNNDVLEHHSTFMSHYLEKFDAVFVGDELSKNITSGIVNKKIEVVLEPIFLVDISFLKSIQILPDISKPYIYVHSIPVGRVVDEQLVKMSESLSDKLNIPIIHNQPGIHFKNELRAFSGGIEEYLGIIDKAEFVLTNSFSTTALAVRYGKEFISVPHISNQDKINDLLSDIGLEDRFTGEVSDIYTILENNIDYSGVTEKLKEHADKSAAFLNNAIKKGKNIKEYCYIDFNNPFKCYGCSACEQVCHTSAIKMGKNEKGFSYPVVDKSLCDDCGKCISVCPKINSGVKDTSHMQKVFAAYTKNKDDYNFGTMGSVTLPILREMIKRGAVVIAPILDKDYNVVYAEAETEDEIKGMVNPTFVMPDNSGILKKAKEILDNGRELLFMGVSCQISGLKNYLGKDYDNLITVDMLCRGAGSPKVFKKYIDELQERYNSKIVDIQMGYKLDNSPLSYVRVLFENGNMEFVRTSASEYQSAIYERLVQQPACYECQFAEPANSISDITLEGYNSIRKNNPDFAKGKALSLIKINTDKGFELFDEVKDKFELLESSTEELRQLKRTEPMQLKLQACSYMGNLDKYDIKTLTEKFC